MKSERERQVPYDITICRIKNDTNKLIHKMDSDTENRLIVAQEERVRGGKDWDIGISRCKLLYRECIYNNVLWYRTGNCIEYPMINHNG